MCRALLDSPQPFLREEAALIVQITSNKSGKNWKWKIGALRLFLKNDFL
jgi:hypothetical protein